MPERPLLLLPSPGGRPRARRYGGSGNLRSPSRARQVERLEPQFAALQDALDHRRAILQTTDPGVVPEEVVVLDIRGTVNDFVKAVQRVPGLEWLGELEADPVSSDDDFFALDRDGHAQPDKRLTRRLFMVFSNHEAQTQIIHLFQAYKKKQSLPHGYAPWGHVFRQLKSARPWNATDRLSESDLNEALEVYQQRGDTTLPCELELWFRRDERKRAAAHNRIVALVAEQGGTIDYESVIPEINYHALAARLPIQLIRQLVPAYTGDIALVECEQLQYMRAAGQMVATIGETARMGRPRQTPTAVPRGLPVIALLDGLPLTGHERLRDRIVVDDPDGWADNYAAERCRHGTAMASLIIHGDLGATGESISRPVYCRPILQPDPKDPAKLTECLPEGILAPDLVLRAVRRLFEAEDGQPPSSPDVAVISLSIGMATRPFGHSLSPLARLLDWLAWTYRVLFVVSAGNHRPPPSEPGVPPSESDPVSKQDEMQRTLLHALASDTSNRRLLSPAESMNALTIGAEQADVSDAPAPPRWAIPYAAPGLPSPISAHGMGYRRSVKPDILMPGGKVVVRDPVSGDGALDAYHGPLPPGQVVAVPGQTVYADGTRHTRGTSNSTALATREASFLYDLLDQLRTEPGGAVIDAVPRALWLKTLLVHGADWGLARKVFQSVLVDTEYRRKFREFVPRMIGYGAANVERVRYCTPSRVIALGGGQLRNDQSHIHRFPVPHIASQKGRRKRLAITLSWFTPVNPTHQAWRRAHLWADVGRQELVRTQADARAAGRGTVQHEVWEGTAAITPIEGCLDIRVNCREEAGQLNGSVPYTLAVTLEITDDLEVDIYDEVRAAVEKMREAVPVEN